MHPPEPHKIFPDTDPPELMVHDELSSCPYLADQAARMPLRLPIRALRPQEFDLRLLQGDRRHGMLLYRPSCPSCQACQAIRIPIDRFRLSKTQRRILARNDGRIRLKIGSPVTSRSRVLLYEKHLTGRGLRSVSDDPMSLPRYRQFLSDTCCHTLEFTYWLDMRLVAVAITDAGELALSAHYTFYDPEFASWSLGTYSILKQLEVARDRGMPYLYLGLYVEGNAHMRYKARFLPHERLIGGDWRVFERSC